MIVHCIFTRSLAGAERSALNTVEALQNAGHSASILILLDKRFSTNLDRQHFESHCREVGVALRLIEINGKWSWKTLWTFVNLCKTKAVIHSHGYKSDVYLVVAKVIAWFTGSYKPARLVSTLHGHPNAGSRSKWNDRVGAFVRMWMNQVIFVTQDLKNASFLARVFPSKCHVIPNFSPAPKTAVSKSAAFSKMGLSLGSEIFTMGWMGRLEEVKGPDLFMEALKKIEFPCRVLMAGKGSLEDLVNETALPPNIQLHLLQDVFDIDSFFGCLDLFVMSSRLEGAPMVLLEAIQRGVPVVAPRIGGIPSMVASWDLLFTSSNVLELTANIKAFNHASAEQKQTWKSDNLEVCQSRFSQKSTVQKLESAYQLGGL
jgi:glycosyltransferase involved in cell wall biosynthesis